MPGTRCGVAVCKNSLTKTKLESKNVTYHSFPKDPQRRQIWVRRCRRAGPWNPDSCRVCSEHFTDDDYERDLQSELLGLPRKLVLKPDAIPSRNLSSVEDPKPVESEKARRLRQRNQRKLVNELLNQSEKEEKGNGEEKGTSIQIPTSNNDTMNDKATDIALQERNSNEDSVKKSATNLEKEHHKLKTKFVELEKKLKLTEQKLWLQSISNRRLKAEVRRLQRLRLPQAMFRKKATQMLKPLLTKNQIDVLLGRKKHTTWGPEDIKVAFTLRYLSKRAYNYLRDELHYPLPGISTLQRLASKFSLHNGIPHETNT